jgi:hypothetical protein
MHDDILPAIRVQSGRAERASRSCASAGKDSAKNIRVGVGWNIERADSHTAIQCIFVSQETPLLGQSFLGEGLLRRHGRVERRNDTKVRAISREGRAASGAIAAGTGQSPFSEGAIGVPPYGGH